MGASSRAVRGPMPANGMEIDPVPAAPAPAGLGQPLRASGNVSVTATGQLPRGHPARAVSRDPVTPESDRAIAATQGPTVKHRRIMARAAVREATALPRRVLAGTARKRFNG